MLYVHSAQLAKDVSFIKTDSQPSVWYISD